MEEKPSSSLRSNLKRPFLEDDDSNKPPAQKRVRFPKGKKVKSAGDKVPVGLDIEEDLGLTAAAPAVAKNPHDAATERAMRRNQITSELLDEDGTGISSDILAAEQTYEDNENFVEDGIQIEPFNLDKEREEGYFDADGNYVEYVNENNEIKDAWLDNVEVDPKYAGRALPSTNNEDTVRDLSSEDIAKMKRSIANILEPGETVLQALRRLKGTASNRKEKMSADTKVVFDQLTEYAMKLMDNGEYNVYHEKQDVFEREAEGYERLARVRARNVGGDADDFDMFANDDEHDGAQTSNDKSCLVPIPNSGAVDQPSSDNSAADGGALQSDYIYDETSGYYYSSSLGYYYDPTTCLYCSAATGKWYSFNEETGSYDEVNETAPSAS